MPSTWPFCPVTPIHSSELAESTGRGPHGREHRRRQQTLGAQAPGPGGQAQGQRLQQPAQRRHVGWRPRSRLRVPRPGWRGLPSTKLGVHSQAAMADILSSEMGLGPATKGVAGPAGEGGLGGGVHLQSPAGIVSLWGPPGLHEACLLPQSRDPPAEPHLWAEHSRAQGLASVRGRRDGRGGAGRPL